jgi:hypothetical protein
MAIKGCRDLAGARGLGGVEATEPSAKRRPLTVVPDAGRAGGNIKMLPLNSHKAAVNGMDLCKVLAAQSDKLTLGPFFRRTMGDDEVQSH